jgi:hypothetical protein
MVISGLTDGHLARDRRRRGHAQRTVLEPVIRLGVTGLSRAGKTVFITALVANLLNRGRMPQLQAPPRGGSQAVWLQPQPDDTLPRFDYRGAPGRPDRRQPRWPASTRAISELRLSFRVQPVGPVLVVLAGPRTVHLDIVDYPGEWLLDLALLDKTYADWSRHADPLPNAPRPPISGPGPGRGWRAAAGRGARAGAGRGLHRLPSPPPAMRVFDVHAGPVPPARRSGRLARPDLRAPAEARPTPRGQPLARDGAAV